MDWIMKKIIEIKDLHYTYPDGKNSLSGIDLDVYENEAVGIVGSNGAGKTTLLLHLNGILQGQGNVRVLGMEMNGENIKNIRKQVGLVFQNPDDQLFSTTVFDDIAFGPLNAGVPGAEIARTVRGALAQVEMEGYENKTPHHLSTGEKKKISIATVLALPCEVLALDEPTSNLDPHSRKSLIGLLGQLSMAKVIATHDLELVLAICTRVVILHEGKVMAQGEPRAVLGDGRLMESCRLEVPLSLQYRSSFSS